MIAGERLRTQLKRGLAAYVAAGLLLISTTVNALLAGRCRSLDRRLAAAYEEIEMTKVLPRGTSVGTFELLDLHGRKSSFDPARSGRPSILYYFTPTCDWCRRNTRNVNAIHAQLHQKYDIVGLCPTASGLAEFVRTNAVQFPTFVGPSEAVRQRLRLSATPTMIAVASDGTVVGQWRGAFGAEVKQRIEAALKVTLPGLTP